MNETAYLAFLIGLAVNGYDPRHLSTKAHVSEVVDFHVSRLQLNPSPEALAFVKSVVLNHFKR